MSCYQRLSFSSSRLKMPALVHQPLWNCSVFMLASWQLIPAVPTQKNDYRTPWFLLHYTRCSLKEGCHGSQRLVTSQEWLLSTQRQIDEKRNHQGNRGSRIWWSVSQCLFLPPLCVDLDSDHDSRVTFYRGIDKGCTVKF